MKSVSTVFLMLTVLLLVLTGCQKQPQEAQSTTLPDVNVYAIVGDSIGGGGPSTDPGQDTISLYSGPLNTLVLGSLNVTDSECDSLCEIMECDTSCSGFYSVVWDSVGGGGSSPPPNVDTTLGAVDRFVITFNN